MKCMHGCPLSRPQSAECLPSPHIAPANRGLCASCKTSRTGDGFPEGLVEALLRHGEDAGGAQEHQRQRQVQQQERLAVRVRREPASTCIALGTSLSNCSHAPLRATTAVRAVTAAGSATASPKAACSCSMSQQDCSSYATINISGTISFGETNDGQSRCAPLKPSECPCVRRRGEHGPYQASMV